MNELDLSWSHMLRACSFLHHCSLSQSLLKSMLHFSTSQVTTRKMTGFFNFSVPLLFVTHICSFQRRVIKFMACLKQAFIALNRSSLLTRIGKPSLSRLQRINRVVLFIRPIVFFLAFFLSPSKEMKKRDPGNEVVAEHC